MEKIRVILLSIGTKGNHLKELKNKWSSWTVNKYRKFLLEKGIIKYDLFRIDLKTSYFQLNFHQLETTYDHIFKLLLSKWKNKKLTENLEKLSKSDFIRLGTNFKFQYYEVRNGFKIEFLVHLVDYFPAKNIAIRKKIKDYIIKQLKNKKNIDIKKHSEDKGTPIFNFKSFKCKVSKGYYWFRKLGLIRNMDKERFGNSFKVFNKIRTDNSRLRIHKYQTYIKIDNYKKSSKVREVLVKLREFVYANNGIGGKCVSIGRLVNGGVLCS